MTAVLEEVEDPKCPRCENNLSRIPVRSRTDAKTLICAECATDETVETLRGNVTPQRRWPLSRKVRSTSASNRT